MDSPEGYDLLMPPGWVRMPLNRAGARRQVRTMVAERAKGQPSDTVSPVRIALEREVLTVVERAVSGGAVDLYLLADNVRGLPVAASLAVSHVERLGTPEVDLAAFADGQGAGAESEVVDLPCGRAVRTRRSGLAAPPPGPSILVEYVLPVPDDGGHLVLAFASPNVALAEAMVALFDALAATLRWRWPE